jgi:hypothetical protein
VHALVSLNVATKAPLPAARWKDIYILGDTTSLSRLMKHMTTAMDAMKGLEPEEVLKGNELLPNDVVANKEIIDQWYNMPTVEREKYEKKLVRKLDLKLIPLLTLLYLLSFLDRANIGNAKIQGVFSQIDDT